MIELGRHAGFIAAAYGGVFAGIVALIGWTVWQSRASKRRLVELGEQRR
jgi:heme exporter protein CcmD